MTDDTFNARLKELSTHIESLPEEQRPALQALLDETHRRHREIKENFARARESVAEWRLNMQYLLFDLQATRRERDELRRRMGEA